jgi:hypothetical protein
MSEQPENDKTYPLYCILGDSRSLPPLSQLLVGETDGLIEVETQQAATIKPIYERASLPENNKFRSFTIYGVSYVISVRQLACGRYQWACFYEQQQSAAQGLAFICEQPLDFVKSHEDIKQLKVKKRTAVVYPRQDWKRFNHASVLNQNEALAQISYIDSTDNRVIAQRFAKGSWDNG